MKIKILPSARGPSHYEFYGKKVIVWKYGVSQIYDFTDMNDGDIAIMSKFDEFMPIRSAGKIDGELHLELCQVVGAGHWLSGHWFDADDYDPDAPYVTLDTRRSFIGVPTVLTRSGIKTIEIDIGESG